jgi:hypothetical protein
MTTSPGSALLAVHLSAQVPLYIAELRAQGGPTDADRDTAQRLGPVIAAHGDRLLYRSTRAGETAGLANDLGFAIAVLSFCPGGVTVFGQHWEANAQVEERT